ncbi:hypothetical protein EYF80_043729 [Liparis tanakae]|uniref:Uncharacterized protein n=1 Tax=Liparis tanakae TaxID=230148 RepID=A0A4Z2FYZ5_9TELE|nr:hypothetical protein EYF80_043729 [Liparis tanakae]
MFVGGWDPPVAGSGTPPPLLVFPGLKLHALPPRAEQEEQEEQEEEQEEQEEVLHRVTQKAFLCKKCITMDFVE